MPLTIRERMTLDIAGRHFKYPGARINAIRDELGLSEPLFAVKVSALIHRPDAEAEAPALVRRLRRLEAARRDQRRSA